jgi:hypothetical protein
MNAPKVRPLLRRLHQPKPYRILPHIPPFLRITFSIAQSMMKPAGLECPSRSIFFRKSVLPKSHPLLDRKFEIARRTKQMQMIRHQQIITHQPRSRRMFPDAVQGALHGCLRQPPVAFLSTNRKENPIWPARRNVNSLSRSTTPRIEKRNIRHAQFLTPPLPNRKPFRPALNARDGIWGIAAAMPYH